ncbi:MAG: helix-turn-helix domain-containing protein [Candidatus Moranbacteria bacterium]|nr:helix-turn-helix domain-containing protein [Candidatus Moranbacteria bacterium]
MYEKQLLSSGLTKTQAKVLDHLLENGENKAKDIGKAVSIPRGVAYKALDELLDLGLVEKIEKPRQVARFRAAHPRKLEKLFEQKENALKQEKSAFSEILPNLVSAYNLTVNRPGVKFYEGEDGFKKILFDTLTSKTEILMTMNREGMKAQEKFNEINEEYKKRREQAGIKKKILRTGLKPENIATETANSQKYQELTEIRYTRKESDLFHASMQIYDNKVSYQIMDGETLIGILIEDKNIYMLHKTFFNLAWNNIAE